MEEMKKKGTAGRKPSGLEFICVVLDRRLHKKIRELGDYLERETDEKFSMRRTIEWMYTNSVNPDDMQTPDGE